jgi:hypothetical protein
MSALKTISEYYSEDSNKRAVVMKDLTLGNYRVVVTNDSGSSFSTSFDTLEHAETYAEDWVL